VPLPLQCCQSLQLSDPSLLRFLVDMRGADHASVLGNLLHGMLTPTLYCCWCCCCLCNAANICSCQTPACCASWWTCITSVGLNVLPACLPACAAAAAAAVAWVVCTAAAVVWLVDLLLVLLPLPCCQRVQLSDPSLLRFLVVMHHICGAQCLLPARLCCCYRCLRCLRRCSCLTQAFCTSCSAVDCVLPAWLCCCYCCLACRCAATVRP
jgi:hypothetical protein